MPKKLFALLLMLLGLTYIGMGYNELMRDYVADAVLSFMTAVVMTGGGVLLWLDSH